MDKNEATKARNDLQTKIVAEWVAFSRTDAYKDWLKSMSETMQMIQDNVDNMTESRVGGEKNSIDAEKACLMNQRKVGIRYALQYAELRVNAS